MVLSVRAHSGMEDGCLGLNAIQRRCLSVSPSQVTDVIPYDASGELAALLITGDVEFVTKSKSRSETIDAAQLAEHMLKCFITQVSLVVVPASICK
mgnify:CR=1 FL=1